MVSGCCSAIFNETKIGGDCREIFPFGSVGGFGLLEVKMKFQLLN